MLGVQQALGQAGYNWELFNGHSFRIGAATSAKQAGIPETMIKILGRWQSSTYQGYIRPSAPTLAATYLIKDGERSKGITVLTAHRNECIFHRIYILLCLLSSLWATSS